MLGEIIGDIIGSPYEMGSYKTKDFTLFDKDGNDAFNELSEMCLEASGRLLMIDPKINLRVSKKTPLSVYELGSELTKEGLGFPQYSNDDIV